MKLVAAGALALLVAGVPAAAIPSPLLIAAEVGLGIVGGVGGTAVAVTVVGRLAPSLEARSARIAVVVGSLTLLGGLGGAVGVMAAGRLFGRKGHLLGCLAGGMAGGLASAFTEPILYGLGAPAAVTEAFGFLLLPTLPAIGATVGFNR